MAYMCLPRSLGHQQQGRSNNIVTQLHTALEHHHQAPQRWCSPLQMCVHVDEGLHGHHLHFVVSLTRGRSGRRKNMCSRSESKLSYGSERMIQGFRTRSILCLLYMCKFMLTVELKAIFHSPKRGLGLIWPKQEYTFLVQSKVVGLGARELTCGAGQTYSVRSVCGRLWTVWDDLVEHGVFFYYFFVVS